MFVAASLFEGQQQRDQRFDITPGRYDVGLPDAVVPDIGTRCPEED